MTPVLGEIVSPFGVPKNVYKRRKKFGPSGSVYARISFVFLGSSRIIFKTEMVEFPRKILGW